MLNTRKYDPIFTGVSGFLLAITYCAFAAVMVMGLITYLEAASVCTERVHITNLLTYEGEDVLVVETDSGVNARVMARRSAIAPGDSVCQTWRKDWNLDGNVRQ